MSFFSETTELILPATTNGISCQLSKLFSESDPFLRNPIDYTVNQSEKIGALLAENIANNNCARKGIIGQPVIIGGETYLVVDVEERSAEGACPGRQCVACLARVIKTQRKTLLEKTLKYYSIRKDECFSVDSHFDFENLKLQRNPRVRSEKTAKPAQRRRGKASDSDSEIDAEISREELSDLQFTKRSRDASDSKSVETGPVLVNFYKDELLKLPVKVLNDTLIECKKDSTDHNSDLVGAIRILPFHVKDQVLKLVETALKLRKEVSDGHALYGQRFRKPALTKKKRGVVKKSFDPDCLFVLDVLQDEYRRQQEESTLPGVDSLSSRAQVMTSSAEGIRFEESILEMRRALMGIRNELLVPNMEPGKRAAKERDCALLHRRIADSMKMASNTWEKIDDAWERGDSSMGSTDSASRKPLRVTKQVAVSTYEDSFVYRDDNERKLLLEVLFSGQHKRNHFQRANCRMLFAIVMKNGLESFVVLSQVEAEEYKLDAFQWTQTQLTDSFDFVEPLDVQRGVLLELYKTGSFDELYGKIDEVLTRSMRISGEPVRKFLSRALSTKTFCLIPRFFSPGCNDFKHPICHFSNGFFNGLKKYSNEQNNIVVASTVLPSKYEDLFGLPLDAAEGVLTGNFQAEAKFGQGVGKHWMRMLGR